MTQSNTSACYIDLLMSIGRDGQLHTYLHDNRDDFNFYITNFPFLNIPASPGYGVFISQLIRYARLAPRMVALFWGRHDCQISSSSMDTSRNAWNRNWGSFMVQLDTRIFKTMWSSSLTNVKRHSVTWPYAMTTHYWSDFKPRTIFTLSRKILHRFLESSEWT